MLNYSKYYNIYILINEMRNVKGKRKEKHQGYYGIGSSRQALVGRKNLTKDSRT